MTATDRMTAASAPCLPKVGRSGLVQHFCLLLLGLLIWSDQPLSVLAEGAIPPSAEMLQDTESSPRDLSSGASGRKIPVKKWRGKAKPVSQKNEPRATPKTAAIEPLIRQPDQQSELARQYPVPMQPGEVTGVEIRNEAGERIDGELQAGEFYVGPRPERVNIGTPYGPSVLGAPVRRDSVAGMPPGGQTPACQDCNDGACDQHPHGHPHGHPLGPIDRHEARVEALARFLAYPLTDFWVRAEYLRMSIDGIQVPALVTTGNAAAGRDNAGVLGVAGTNVLFGGEIADEDRSGGRIEIGRYLPGDLGLAVSASYLFTEDATSTFRADSATFPVLARPFVNVSPTAAGQDAELYGFPADLTGNLQATASSRLDAADVLVRALLVSQPDRRFETFLGYTSVRLDDDLSIGGFRQVVGAGSGMTLGTTMEHTDRFRTTNDFHGLAIGGRSQQAIGPWLLTTSVKLGLGTTDASVERSGQTRTVTPDGAGGTTVATSSNGLLVQASNSGSESADSFSVAPEVRLMLSRRLPIDWDVTIGYHLLYLSRVMRAGDQIDSLVNPTQAGPGGLNGLARPLATGTWDDMIAQAVAIGFYREF